MHRPRRPSFLVALLLLAPLAMSLAQGHPSAGPPVLTPDWRLEGERYSTVQDCEDPGEPHLYPELDPAASGGKVVNFAADWCTVVYSGISFDDSWRLKEARISVADIPASIPDHAIMTLDVRGWPQASGTHWAKVRVGDLRAGSLLEVPGFQGYGALAGTYAIHVFAYVQGHTLAPARVKLDHLQFECGNHFEIDVSPPLALRGFGPDRTMFWTDREYAFDTSYVDPEGDPTHATWRFDEETHHVVGPLVRSFATETSQDIWVLVLDEPEARCPGAPSSYTWRTYATLTAHTPDWEARLASPPPGQHCINARASPAGDLTPIFAGTCRLQALVDTGDMPRSLIGHAVFRLDGVPFASVPAPFVVDFNSLDHLPGEHALDVCFQAVNDEAQGLNCAPPRTIFVI